MDRPATAAQQKYLRSLAQKTGTSFTPPKTVGEASRQIKELLGRSASEPGDAWADRQAVSEGLTNGISTTAVRDGEVTGYGSGAHWRGAR